MQNINPSHSIARRGRFYLFFGGLAFFGGAIALTLAVLFFFFPLWETASFGVVRALLILVGLVTLIGGIAHPRADTAKD